MNPKWLSILLPAVLASAACAQLADPLSFALLKEYRAFRSSSNNPDPDSNDDSNRPSPGETVVLADLPGPGMVTHICLTAAANEYGWPRLLRLRVYYDGSSTPSVDAPRARWERLVRMRGRHCRCCASWRRSRGSAGLHTLPYARLRVAAGKALACRRSRICHSAE